MSSSSTTSNSTPDNRELGQLEVTVDELEVRVRERLELTDWRAMLAVVVAPPGLEQAAERVRETLAQELDLGPNQIVDWTPRDGDERLATLNRMRDELMAKRRLIWLRLGSAADVRRVRRRAPDLTASPDLFVELCGPREGQGWAACRRQLCELMADRHSTLDFTGLLPANVQQTQLPLDELYLPLVERSLMQPPSPDEDEQGPPALLVLGHPGTGKTTYLRHLAVTYAKASGDPLKVGPLAPLLVSLSDYAWEREQGRVRNVMEFLPSWLAEQGIEGGTSVGEHVGELLLLLDGLDEIPTSQARRAVLTEVGALQRERRLGAAVLTGRSFLVDELRQQDHDLQIVSTRTPQRDEIRQFLTKFVSLRSGDQSHANDLITRIEGDRDLRALARTPLMLAFMAILDELEGRLPERRIEIYYRLGEMLVDRWTRSRSIGTGGLHRERPTRADALRVLGPLAWWTVERGGGAIPEDALFNEIQRIEAKREGPEEAMRRARALLDLLRADTALLVPRPRRRWSFVHASIGEYFAGVEVERDRRRWRALLDDPFRPEWREILLFCAGQLGVIEGRTESLDTLIDAVLRRSRRAGRYDAKYPSLLIGLLSESPGLSRRQIDRLVARLLEFMLTNAFSDEAARQAQLEFVVLLHSARGSVHASLEQQLRVWFSSHRGYIRWDRVIREDWRAKYFIRGWYRGQPLRQVAHMVLGLIVASICLRGWPGRYGVDLDWLDSRWRQQSDWRYRFARWLMTLDPEDLDRPYGELADGFEAFE